jgi:rhamnosyltransferase
LDENLKKGIIFGEDMHAAGQLLLKGKSIAYCAEAQVFHSHNYTVIQDFRRYFDMGVFHESEKWLLEKFGRAEKQASRYVRSEIEFLMNRKKHHLLAHALLRSIAKYTGYRMGRSHRYLPHRLNRTIGMNHLWWDM